MKSFVLKRTEGITDQREVQGCILKRDQLTRSFLWTSTPLTPNPCLRRWHGIVYRPFVVVFPSASSFFVDLSGETLVLEIREGCCLATGIKMAEPSVSKAPDLDNTSPVIPLHDNLRWKASPSARHFVTPTNGCRRRTLTSLWRAEEENSHLASIEPSHCWLSTPKGNTWNEEQSTNNISSWY